VVAVWPLPLLCFQVTTEPFGTVSVAGSNLRASPSECMVIVGPPGAAGALVGAALGPHAATSSSNMRAVAGLATLKRALTVEIGILMYLRQNR